MYDELASALGTGKIIGFFGDKNFPNKNQGKLVREKREAFQRIQAVLAALKPKKIYICPETGLSNSILSLLTVLDIPYSIVNPYRGYFDNVTNKTKLTMWIGLENSSSVITLSEKLPDSVAEQQKLFKESQEFLIKNSDIILTAFGNDPHERLCRTTEYLFGLEKKPVIALSYAT